MIPVALQTFLQSVSEDLSKRDDVHYQIISLFAITSIYLAKKFSISPKNPEPLPSLPAQDLHPRSSILQTGHASLVHPLPVAGEIIRLP